MNKKNISIVIADDHPLILKGLYQELTANDYRVTGLAANGLQALELILQLEPSLALIDIDMPFLTGLEVIKKAKDKNVPTKFIVFSFHKETDYIAQATTLKIDGYLLKEDPFSEIESCIEAVMNHEHYFSRTFDEATLQNADQELRKLKFLTPSETTILKMIAQQLSTKDIADSLCVSNRTIEKHRSNIISKLSVNTDIESLTDWAVSHKMIVLDL